MSDSFGLEADQIAALHHEMRRHDAQTAWLSQLPHRAIHVLLVRDDSDTPVASGVVTVGGSVHIDVTETAA